RDRRALCHSTRQLIRISPLESLQPDQLDVRGNGFLLKAAEIGAFCKPSPTFCQTVAHGNNRGSWKTIPRSRPVPTIGLPSCVSSPLKPRSSPASNRNSVDLPQPLGPTIDTNSPGWI